MKVIPDHKYKISCLRIMFILSFARLIGFCFGKPTDKVGSHLEKVKDFDNKLSLKKIDGISAVEKIMLHLKAAEKLNDKIQSHEPMKDFLFLFVKYWNSKELILATHTDEKHPFMTVVNTFFLRGYVKSGEGWKTLFPLFKPWLDTIILPYNVYR